MHTEEIIEERKVVKESKIQEKKKEMEKKRKKREERESMATPVDSDLERHLKEAGISKEHL